MKRARGEKDWSLSDEEETVQEVKKKPNIMPIVEDESMKPFESFGKKELRKIRDGKLDGFRIEKSGKHSQAKGFVKVLVKSESNGDIFPATFVMCTNCNDFYVQDGGHLRRHSDSCSDPTTSTINPKQDTSESKLTNCSDFHNAIIQYFARTATPLHLLESTHFTKLLLEFAKLGQEYKGVCDESILMKRTTARKHVESSLDQKRSEIFESLAPFFEDKTISILVDFGKLSVDFLSVKGCYLSTTKDKNGIDIWKPVIAPIAMAPARMGTKDAHSVFKIISESVEKCFEDCNLADYNLVADGGSNVRGAGNNYFLSYIRCAAHSSEIVGKRMIHPYKKNPPTASETKSLAKYSNILTKTKELTMELKSNRFIYKDLSVSLVSPVETRWMSSYDCANGIYTNIQKLIANLNMLSTKSETILLELSNNDNRQLFNELKSIYEPIKVSNQMFQSNSSNISDVLLVYLGLLEECEMLKAKSAITSHFKVLIKFAEKAIIKQLGDLADEHYVALYLNPSYKSIDDLQKRLDQMNVDVDCEVAIDRCLRKLDALLNPSVQNQSHSTINQIPTDFKSRIFLKRTTPVSKTLEVERKQYEADTQLLGPMIYWPSNERRFPRLHKIAKKIFSTPSTESDVERSFSLLKNVYQDNRRSLDLEYLQKLMIVKQNEYLAD